MKNKIYIRCLLSLFVLVSVLYGTGVYPQDKADERKADEKVKAFLNSRRGTWVDLNVPESDGRILYDLIVKNHYRKALEIGTSTGHSAIWIAWALSKTDGRLITIEIDEQRYRTALANFRQAGLAGYIDARLADAHDLVKQLNGPFDFVFCDADKDWYQKYFMDVYPKLVSGGCYVAHNVSGTSRPGSWLSGSDRFYEYIRRLPDMETTVDLSGRGMSISYKKTN